MGGNTFLHGESENTIKLFLYGINWGLQKFESKFFKRYLLEKWSVLNCIFLFKMQGSPWGYLAEA